MKRCSKCGVEKEITEFHVAKRCRSGRAAGCKACSAAYKARHYEQIKADQEKYTAFRAQQREYQRRKQGSTYRMCERTAEASSRTAKKCSVCGDIKPLSEFFRNHKSPDGKGTRCKVCTRAYSRAWHNARYADDPEYAARCRAKAGLIYSMGAIADVPSDLIEAKAAQLLVRRFIRKGE